MWFKNLLARLRHFFVWVVLPLLGLVFLLCLVMGLFPLSIWQYSYEDETRPADAAIVLGAAVYTNKPSPVFMERINHGIGLYKKGHVKKLVFTGAKDEYDEISEAAAGRAAAIDAGIPEEDILVEELSTKTWQNLVNSIEVLENNDLQTVLIVSDPLHMKRAMVMAKDLGMWAYSSPTKTSRYRSGEAKWEFLKSETLYLAGYTVRKITGFGGDWEREDAESMLKLADEVGREMLGKPPVDNKTPQ